MHRHSIWKLFHIYLLFKSSKGVTFLFGIPEAPLLCSIVSLQPPYGFCSFGPLFSKWKLIVSYLFSPPPHSRVISYCLEALQDSYQVKTYPQLRSTAFGTCIDGESGPFRWMRNRFLDEDESGKYCKAWLLLLGLSVFPSPTPLPSTGHFLWPGLPGVMSIIHYDRDEATQNSTSETALGLGGGHPPLLTL